MNGNRLPGRATAWFVAIAIGLLSYAGWASDQPRRVNLALHKPATSSSIENAEHSASAANDGDPVTCWRADDEPEGAPDWWQVDLQMPSDLTGCAIRWPFPGMKYRYKVEGSADGKLWAMLSDQTQTTVTRQTHELSFAQAKGIRYLKITITSVEDGCLASISEVRVFGNQ